jgi:hypothetical protein
MAERTELQSLITTNLPDNSENYITPARVRTVVNYIKDNYATATDIEDFVTEQQADDAYIPVASAASFITLPLTASNTYATFLTLNAEGSAYYQSSFIDGGTF